MTTLNTLSGDVVLAAGTNVTLTPSGNTITIASSGGGGSPGGSSGQVQYNNGGVFGGVFIGGDGTFNATSGNLVITKTNGTNFAASATTDATNATNITSGTLPVARMPAITGDVTTTAGAVASTLATVNSNVGSFTNANLTINAKGLVTSASNGTATAGGSSGQVQYNNAGSLAGVSGITLTSGALASTTYGGVYLINNQMQMFDGSSVKAQDVPARTFLDNAGSQYMNGNLRVILQPNGTTAIDFSSNSGLQTSKFFKYNTVPMQGNGIASIPGWGPRVVAATSAQTLATFTSTFDGSYYISANLLVTASTVFSISVTCTYTDEGGTSRTATLSFSQLTGTILNLITNTQGAGPYEGIPLHIRAKANTAITIQTTGTFTTVTYNGEGSIMQIA